ncbi:MAG: DsbA family protein [bacterium]|nr:DsbA family protein [bacterium]
MLTKPDFYKKMGKETEKVEGHSKSRSSVPEPRQKDYILPTILVSLAVIFFFLGMMWSKVNNLEKQALGGNSNAVQPPAANLPAANNPTNNAAVQAPPPVFDVAKLDKLASSDHLFGNKNAQVQLIIYSDLECPFSKRFQTTTVKQITEQYKDKVAIVYRHFPLDAIHSKARKEAEATECATKLAGNDGFWKLTNKIYEATNSNNSLDLASLPSLAVSVGLNEKNFKDCLDGGQMSKTIESQYQSGVKVGITGTPGSILLDTKTGKAQLIPGALPFEQIKPTIDQYLTL